MDAALWHRLAVALGIGLIVGFERVTAARGIAGRAREYCRQS